MRKRCSVQGCLNERFAWGDRRRSALLIAPLSVGVLSKGMLKPQSNEPGRKRHAAGEPNLCSARQMI